MYLTTRGQRRRAAEDRKQRRKVAGKGGKTRYLPLHPATNELINDYLDAAGHGLDEAGALFRPVQSVMAAQTPFRCLTSAKPDCWGERDRRSLQNEPPKR